MIRTIGQVVSYLSFMEHYDHLVRGLIDTQDLVYFATHWSLMLFLTHRVVDSAQVEMNLKTIPLGSDRRRCSRLAA